jgi:hypothetical protein
MRLIFRCFCLFFMLQFASKAEAQNAWCQISGAVFIDTNPNRIQYRVFIEESESFADMLVFKASNTLFADKPGLWYFTNARAQATTGIMIVKERSLADFSIHFIDTETFAGCQTAK